MLFATRPMAVRVMLLAIVAAFMVGALVVFVNEATAGVPYEFEFAVNTAVDDAAAIDDDLADGECDIAGAGTLCSLRAAIMQANELNQSPGLITFDPTFFPPPPGTPTTIYVDQLGILCDGGVSPLPPITVDDLTIDATGAGVVISGDCDKDGTADIVDGLAVHAGENSFDFTLIGGSGLTVTDFSGDAVVVCGDADVGCDTYGLDHVEIDGIKVRDVGVNGVDIRGANLNDVWVTNNDINANGGTDGVYILAMNGGAKNEGGLIDNTVSVNDNVIRGEDEAVEIEFKDDLNSTIMVSVNDNTITSDTDNGIEIDYCDDLSGCNTSDSKIGFEVLRNDIDADDDGVHIHIEVDSAVTNSNVDANVDINDNVQIISDDYDAVDVDINICCGTSGSSGSVNINGNGDLLADDEAVEVDTYVCCNNDNSTTINVNDNGDIVSNGSGSNEAIDIEGFAGDNSGVGDGDENTATASISRNGDIISEEYIAISVDKLRAGDDSGGAADDNTATLDINDNASISGLGSSDNGMKTNVEAGRGGGGDDGGDDNTATTNINNNGPIIGDYHGMEVTTAASKTGGGGAAGDDNTATTNINGNDSIEGVEANAIRVKNSAGTKGGGGDAGDNNTATLNINDNGPITGDDYGITIENIAGSKGSGVIGDGNTGNTSISRNGEISGQSGDGIELEAYAGSADGNVNNIDINENEDGINGSSRGVDIDTVCCSRELDNGLVNNINIMDNEGEIRGDTSDGISISADFDSTANALTIATISGNDISNSGNGAGDNGIALSIGAFGSATLGRSQISNNTISGNADAGVSINSAWLVVVGPDNVISGNGSGTGIEIVDTYVAGLAFSNTITRNSILDNEDLGIDLDDDGVGCSPIGSGPNRCLPFPGFVTTLIVTDDKLAPISGSAGACPNCLVEVFLADEIPDDQDNHGEGALFLGDGLADADGGFSVDLPCDLAAGFVTTTATDPTGNTSEFSENIPFSATQPCATPTPTVTDTPTVTNTPDVTDTPTPTNTPVATPTPTIACGDVNGDGDVNSIDATLIFQLKAGFLSTLDNPSRADVNNSGDITSVDGALILQVGAGFITEAALTCPA